MIAVLNESTACTDAEVQSWLPALQTQVDRDFAPIWGVAAPLQFLAKRDPAAEGHWQMVVLDNSDQAGALGYHDTTASGLPLGKVFAATAEQYGQSVSVTMSHELLEMLADPYINMTATVEDAEGNISRLYAWENCDAVEDDQFAYEIDGVRVSDFVFPAWFDPMTRKNPLDYCGHVTKPLQLLSGGYIGFWTPSGGWSQQTASARYQDIPSVGSRPERRARGRAKWLRSVPRTPAA